MSLARIVDALISEIDWGLATQTAKEMNDSHCLVKEHDYGDR